MPDLRTEFLEQATWHGTLERARAILAEHPGLARADIHTAAVLGDAETVRSFLAAGPDQVAAASPPYGAPPLVYLGLSKFLRLEPERSAGFLDAARALLDAGADPNGGFWTTGRFPERETALYGAAGVAHHEELTRLLIERGADPNDEEAVYHSPESAHLGAMRVLVETGKVTPDNLSLMLVRKHDWHDYEGARYLLERGADPNLERTRGFFPLHHAVARDNDTPMFELLLDHGADPRQTNEGLTGVARAARRGRKDLLELFARRGVSVELAGVDRLIAACAVHDEAEARAIATREPALLEELLHMGGTLLAEFAGTWNTRGVESLLDLGVPVTAYYGGDGYWGIAEQSTALHVAAWKGKPDTVKLLLDRGAPVNARDARGRTPLMLAVKACVDSYWTETRTPETTRLLLEAGATADQIALPSGYDEVDALLGRHRGRPAPRSAP